MQKVTEYRNALLAEANQELYLLNNSCLPGPRSNLELLYAFIEVSELSTVNQFLNKQYLVVPVNTPEEFVECCAIAACGKHILKGNKDLIKIIRNYASDSRWRIRESVAMALQHIGKAGFEKLKETISGWEKGNCYEQRAVAAGLCEPAILKSEEIKKYTLDILKEITYNLPAIPDKKTASYKTLTQALCYCWSVAVAAHPNEGKCTFQELIYSNDKDILKIAKENLKKNRMVKMDRLWVEYQTNLIS